MRSIGNSEATVKSRRGDVRGLITWCEAHHDSPFDLQRFASEDIPHYRDWLFSRFKITTANRRLTSLNLILKWAVTNRLVKRQDFQGLRHRSHPDHPQSIRHVLDSDAQARFVESVRASGNARALVAMKLMIDCGLRVSELCALKSEDVKIRSDRGTVSLPVSKSRKPIDIPLPGETCKLLSNFLKSKAASSNAHLLQVRSGPISRRAIAKMVDKYGRNAGLENLTPKILRRTFIMNLVRSGVDPTIIAMLAGNELTELARRYGSIRLSRCPAESLLSKIN